MTLPTTCSQSGCGEPATHRFAWPGRDEAGICAEHLGQLAAISRAMGLPLQTIPLAKTELEAT